MENYVQSESLLAQLKNMSPMLWGTMGYLFLFIFRPFEYWTWLGEWHIERVYMLVLLPVLFLWRGKRYVHHPIMTAFIAFFLVICFSIIIAYYPPAAIREAEEYFKLLVLFFLIILTVRDENDFRIFVMGFIAIMGLYIGKSLWEFLLHDRHVYGMGIRRLIGIDQTYSDPNTFAASVVYSLPLAWALWKSDLSRTVRRWMVGYGVMSAVAVVFTGSRSGMVTLVLLVAVLWAASGGRKVAYKLLRLFGVIILLFAIWLVIPEEYQLRYMTMFDDSINASATESAQGRIEGLKNGMKLFEGSPIFGWGGGNFPYAVETIGIHDRMQSHNLYGQLAADLGLLGIVAFSIVCWTLYRTNSKIQMVARKAAQTNSGSTFMISAVGTACMQTMLLLLFQGNFGHNLYRYSWPLIGAILVVGHSLIVEKE